ncbi:MAG: RNA polymerase sigma factor, partial [Oscillospiraceae bacterium]
IAVNKCKNLLKGRRDVSLDEMQEEENYPEIPDEGLLPEDYVMDAAKRRIVMDIMEKVLSDIQYQTVILFYFDNMSIAEIAEITDSPTGTVTYRLNAARAKIKEGVLNYENENKDRLHAFMPIVPFLTKLLNAEADSVQVPDILSNIGVGSAAEAAANVSQAASAANTASTAGTAVKSAGFFSTVAGKITAAIVAVAVIGGGIGIGAALSDSDDDDEEDDDDSRSSFMLSPEPASTSGRETAIAMDDYYGIDSDTDESAVIPSDDSEQAVNAPENEQPVEEDFYEDLSSEYNDVYDSVMHDTYFDGENAYFANNKSVYRYNVNTNELKVLSTIQDENNVLYTNLYRISGRYVKYMNNVKFFKDTFFTIECKNYYEDKAIIRKFDLEGNLLAEGELDINQACISYIMPDGRLVICGSILDDTNKVFLYDNGLNLIGKLTLPQFDEGLYGDDYYNVFEYNGLLCFAPAGTRDLSSFTVYGADPDAPEKGYEKLDSENIPEEGYFGKYMIYNSYIRDTETNEDICFYSPTFFYCGKDYHLRISKPEDGDVEVVNRIKIAGQYELSPTLSYAPPEFGLSTSDDFVIFINEQYYILYQNEKFYFCNYDENVKIPIDLS